MTRRFTGWHMLAVMLAMFGTIIAVNLVMARYAIGTFGGTVVDNSYVASQRYNRWLAEARTQEAMGWTAAVTVDAGRHAALALADRDAGLDGATVTAVATHPLGRATARTLRFTAAGGGRYRSVEALPPGRWLLRIAVRRDGRLALFDDEVPA